MPAGGKESADALGVEGVRDEETTSVAHNTKDIAKARVLCRAIM
jgi:hypothetical protein